MCRPQFKNRWILRQRHTECACYFLRIQKITAVQSGAMGVRLDSHALRILRDVPPDAVNLILAELRKIPVSHETSYDFPVSCEISCQN